MKLFRDGFARSSVAYVVILWAAELATGSLFPLYAQDVVLSEFMARNDSTLADDDGDYSDWVEIYNGTSERINLAGWRLSDDSSDLEKWSFPPVALAPSGYLIVFVSGKDRAHPARPLHTSFKLSGGGEFFALIRPDGEIATAFSPEFPRQLADRSYGLAHEFAGVQELVGHGSAGKVLVPLDDSLALDWVAPEFDDAAWLEGQNGFGFDQKARPIFEDFFLTDIGADMRDVNASAYVRIPFELEDPATVDFLRLEMLFEDGFIAYVNGLEVARGQAPDFPRWDSEATGSRTAAAAATIEDVEISEAKSVLRAGRNVLAIHGLNRAASNSDFFVLPTLKAFSVGPISNLPRYFEVPTPGWPNGAGFEAASEDPEFSLPGGVYADGVTLEITAATPDTEIRYTLDGSEPDSNAALYTGPIAVQSNVQVRARSFTPNLMPSSPVEARYVLMSGDVVDFTSDLPVFVISTFGRPIKDWVPAYVHIVDRGANGRSALSTGEAVDYSGIARIKERGSSTGGRQKQSYSLELWEAENDPVDVEVLGLPAESDWVLYGPYNFDRANIRNALMYELSRRAGLYASRTRFIEMFVNKSNEPLSASHYFGLYVLVEKIKQGEHRVNVGKLEPEHLTEPEITGGYIIKWDRPDPGDVGFFGGGEDLKHVYPKESEIPPIQKAWLIDFLNRFNTALRGPNAADPLLGYEAFIDVDSFIDVNLLNEFAKEGDLLSTYYNKPKNGKFRAGPLWDYDRTLNSDDDFRSRDPNGWSGIQGRNWWGALLAEPGFYSRYRARWIELRAGPLSTANVFELIDSMAAEILEAQERNFNKWTGLVDGTPGWRTEIQQLKTWIGQRVRWIDTAFLVGPEFSVPGGRVTLPFEVELVNPNARGEIIYTLNGPDPQLPNDLAAPEAIVYEGPIAITENTRITARVSIDQGIWSEMSEEIYVVTVPSLALSEIMYNAPGSSSYEFLEVLNFGDEPLDLNGFAIGNAVKFEFGNQSIQPGEYLVVIKEMEGFVERYPTEGVRIAGLYDGTLRNRGETVELVGPLGETLVSVSYQDEWYAEADGLGHSLVLVDPHSPSEAWSEASSWRPSLQVNGSPGREDSIELPSGGQKPGDSNRDGRLNLTDAIHLLNFLFTGSIALPCGDGSVQHAANVALLDTNGDLSINLTDSVYNLTYLFSRGPPPVQGQGCIEILECPGVCE